MNPQAPAAPGAPPASAGITAASPQAPTALPQAASAVPQFDTAGTLGAIRSYYQIPQAAQAAGVQGQGLAGQSDWMNKRNEIESNYAREQAAHAADAAAYRLQADPKGGPSKLYNIYTGQQVNALEFQQKTGQDPSALYKNSTNKFDQTFANDYQNYQSYMSAVLNQGNKANKQLVLDFQQAHPQLKNMKPDQLRQAFMSTYSSYFGGGGGAPSSSQYSMPYSPQAESYFAEYGARTGQQPAYQTSQGSSGQFGGVNLNQFAPQAKKKK